MKHSVNCWMIGGVEGKVPVAKAAAVARDLGYAGIELCFGSGELSPDATPGELGHCGRRWRRRVCRLHHWRQATIGRTSLPVRTQVSVPPRWPWRGLISKPRVHFKNFRKRDGGGTMRDFTGSLLQGDVNWRPVFKQLKMAGDDNYVTAEVLVSDKGMTDVQ